MTRAAWRLRHLAASAVVGAGVALAAPAPPALAAACTEGGGVSVVVDFSGLGGSVRTECAAGDPSSGIVALRDAGFTPTRAAQQAGYFVCRIDGLPASDPCQRASPSDAYWSYWTAQPGGSWAFSSRGADGRDPAPGSVEGWSFGAGDPPSVPPPTEQPAPAQQPAPAPEPAPAAEAPEPAAPAPAASPPAPGRITAPSATGSGPAAAAPEPTAPTIAAPTAEPSAVPTDRPGADPTRETTQPSTQPAAAQDSGGSGAAITTAVIVALLGAAGGWQVWRRRRPQDGLAP